MISDINLSPTEINKGSPGLGGLDLDLAQKVIFFGG